MSGSPSRSNNIEAVFPLSPTQEGMLYHTLKNPESAVYVGQHVMEDLRNALYRHLQRITIGEKTVELR